MSVKGGEFMPFYPPNRRNPFFQPSNQQNFRSPYSGMPQQPFYFPPQQPPPSRFGQLPEQLNTLMGHADKISYGVSMIRQVGAIVSLFR